jgi:hypothetical protein
MADLATDLAAVEKRAGAGSAGHGRAFGIAIRVPGAGGVVHDVLQDHALMHSLVI